VRKYAKFLILTKENTHRKGNLNPLGRPEIHQTEMDSPVFYPNPKYT